MYDIIDRKTKKVIKQSLGVSDEQFRTKETKPNPTNIKNLTDKFGHQKTHDLLKSYGPQWILFDGKIFFERNQNG